MEAPLKLESVQNQGKYYPASLQTRKINVQHVKLVLKKAWKLLRAQSF